MRTNAADGGPRRLLLVALVAFGLIAMHQLPVAPAAPEPVAVEHVQHQQPPQPDHHDSGHSVLHLCLAIMAAAIGLLLALWWIATVRPFRRPLSSRLIDGRMRPRPPPCTTPDVFRLRVLRL